MLVATLPLSAPSLDMPPAFMSRDCIFYHEFESLFYTIADFFNHLNLFNSNLASWLITHFPVVCQL